MTKRTVKDDAIVVFLQALGCTIWNIENLKPEERNTDNVMRSFDYYLKATVTNAETKGGREVEKDVEALHYGLKDALEKAKLANAPTGQPT